MSRLYTIGHSARSLKDLLEVLHGHEIERLVDVRRFPGSRRHPHFSRDALAAALGEAEIDYVWAGDSLGGRRRSSWPREASPNAAWNVAGFRSYADYMQTQEFAEGLARLELLGRECRTAIMCAEALWSRCHRRLIADALVVRGWEVLHVTGPGPARSHVLPEFAVLDEGRLTYPRGDD